MAAAPEDREAALSRILSRHKIKLSRRFEEPGACRYIVTWAQNATPVHARFWQALQHYPGKLVVDGGRYKNPTSIWAENDRADQWYAPEVEPFLTMRRSEICANLVSYADIHIVPTAEKPLTGWHVFCGESSGVFGHPRRALQVIPTDSRWPRILATTGACTVPNYTDSRAGAKGHAHHTIGALVVEVDADGRYFLRQVTADEDGCFYDLDKRYTPGGVVAAEPALGLTIGDLHERWANQRALAATRGLAELTMPRNAILHDVFDGYSRSHHAEKDFRELFDRHQESVEAEIAAANERINDVRGWLPDWNVHVVWSNHHEHLQNWLQRAKPKEDLASAEYFFDLWSRAFAHRRETGEWPDAFAMECRRLGSSRGVRFLAPNEPLRIGGVAHQFHGDRGVHGSRGTSAGFSKIGVPTSTAHTHTPAWIDGNVTAGHTSQPDHGYNTLPGSWAIAQILQYADGNRALIFIIDDMFRVEVEGDAHPKARSPRRVPRRSRRSKALG